MNALKRMFNRKNTMKNTLYIYLAGNIRKGKEEEHDQAWSDGDMDALRCALPEHTLVFLNPATRSDDLSDQKSVFGRDLFMVFSSSLVLVDARGKRGLGVGAEMMFAKLNQIPVVSWCPPNTHYQRDTLHLLGQEVRDWVHPFVYSLSDYIAPSLESAASWISNVMSTPAFNSKGPEAVREAINHYLSTQLSNDTGMKQLVAADPHFDEVVKSLNCFV
jgi:hypothetical protein